MLLLMAVFIDPRKNDRPQRFFARNILRMAGAKFRVVVSNQFDPNQTCIFVSNHVNLFDPFVLYSAIPQFVRGWELESHFRIPIYGRMMKRFGNIPVADVKTPGNLKKLFRLTRQALEQGISLIVFPEGGRTRTGHVQPFRQGIFRMVRDLGYPIVPVSIVGSFEFYHKGSWMLHLSEIVVYIHDPIHTQNLSSNELNTLQDRVQEIVSQPLMASYGLVSSSKSFKTERDTTSPMHIDK
ncbi:MAG: hypothetical protein A3F68_10215 [Acidobacteria bacterium RIFCSPLOWO2_12_FULL_54_10]|nr:MAG: hypothetical protein A3F68_10215 [Acidobacteria bacterium RIFCSPLOWO2_12_FULL_54_10]